VKLSRKMVFQRFGRSYHLRIANAQDLAAVVDLDEAHWVATSAPVATIRYDATLLSLLDRDGDGRIRAADLKAAIRWLLDHLSDTSGIDQRSQILQPVPSRSVSTRFDKSRHTSRRCR